MVETRIERDLVENMFDDTMIVPENNDLEELSKLVQEMIALEGEIEVINLQLVQKTNDYRAIAEKKIPELMLNMGVAEVTLSTGHKLSINKVYSASIKPEKQQEVFDWLAANNHDDIIKNEVRLNFGKGEDEDAALLIAALIEQGYAVDNKRYVHAQTLKAFVKEQIESGVAEFPTEAFGVFILDRAKVKAPKKKGGF